MLGGEGWKGGGILRDGVVEGVCEGGGEVGEEGVFFGIARDGWCWDVGWLDGEGKVERGV